MPNEPLSDAPLTVEFLSDATLVTVLDGWDVHVELADGTTATGQVVSFIVDALSDPERRAMVDIVDLETDRLIVGTHVRNFTKITVL